MSNFIVIFIALVAGFLCQRVKHFPANTAQSLNAFVIYLSLPAVILTQFPTFLAHASFEPLWWVPVSMAWIAFGLSYVVISNIGRRLNWSRTKTGALILTAGLGNTSFVGFPLLDALIGPEAVRIGVLVDQPGSFFVLSTLGLAVAASFSGNKVSASAIGKRAFTFPPFLALVVAALWFVIGMPGTSVITPPLDRIASTLVPIALFAVGFQLQLNPAVLAKRWQPLAIGLGFKLIALPIFFGILLVGIVGSRSLSTHVTLLESAMAPMITSAVVAIEFGLDAEIANLMLGIGIPLSLITVPVWHLVLGHF